MQSDAQRVAEEEAEWLRRQLEGPGPRAASLPPPPSPPPPPLLTGQRQLLVDMLSDEDPDDRGEDTHNDLTELAATLRTLREAGMTAAAPDAAVVRPRRDPERGPASSRALAAHVDYSVRARYYRRWAAAAAARRAPPGGQLTADIEAALAGADQRLHAAAALPLSARWPVMLDFRRAVGAALARATGAQQPSTPRSSAPSGTPRAADLAPGGSPQPEASGRQRVAPQAPSWRRRSVLRRASVVSSEQGADHAAPITPSASPCPPPSAVLSFHSCAAPTDVPEPLPPAADAAAPPELERLREACAELQRRAEAAEGRQRSEAAAAAQLEASLRAELAELRRQLEGPGAAVQDAAPGTASECLTPAESLLQGEAQLRRRLAGLRRRLAAQPVGQTERLGAMDGDDLDWVSEFCTEQSGAVARRDAAARDLLLGLRRMVEGPAVPPAPSADEEAALLRSACEGLLRRCRQLASPRGESEGICEGLAELRHRVTQALPPGCAPPLFVSADRGTGCAAELARLRIACEALLRRAEDVEQAREDAAAARCELERCRAELELQRERPRSASPECDASGVPLAVPPLPGLPCTAHPVPFLTPRSPCGSTDHFRELSSSRLAATANDAADPSASSGLCGLLRDEAAARGRLSADEDWVRNSALAVARTTMDALTSMIAPLQAEARDSGDMGACAASLATLDGIAAPLAPREHGPPAVPGLRLERLSSQGDEAASNRGLESTRSATLARAAAAASARGCGSTPRAPPSARGVAAPLTDRGRQQRALHRAVAASATTLGRHVLGNMLRDARLEVCPCGIHPVDVRVACFSRGAAGAVATVFIDASSCRAEEACAAAAAARESLPPTARLLAVVPSSPRGELRRRLAESGCDPGGFITAPPMRKDAGEALARLGAIQGADVG
eukprot:TRINITY_DN1790_c1_g1_i2.p1 TRINITY_DN1790_c1_g1~~TRINITY_DN1790_c1_g1_i2.p1  ORF type:complete len:911 (+),score=217.42 TRINITY_DN1790_c1_g1_i2:72-2804(+)